MSTSTPRFLVMDIETIPESEIAGEWQPTQAEIDRADGKPFPPIWVHKVVSIGMLALDPQLHPVKGGCAAGGLAEGALEKDMIARWSEIASGKMHKTSALRLVDWNGRGFDVPVLQTRAFRYGVDMSWYFGKIPDNKGQISSFSRTYRDRYAGHHMDLADLWNNHGAFQRPHLANLAMLMGLPGKVGIDGSKVHDAYKDGEHKAIDTYCMQDVYQTALIFQRFEYMKGNMSLEKYREAAGALADFIAKAPGQEDFAKQFDRAALMME